MIYLERELLMDVFYEDLPRDQNIGHKRQLKESIFDGDGIFAANFFVKKGYIRLTADEVEREIHDMWDENLISVDSYENTLLLLRNAQNGLERVTTMIVNKRRIIVD